MVARTHLHTIDVPVPRNGFGLAIDAYYGWCEAHLPPGSWAAFNHSTQEPGSAPQDHLRFFFLEPGQARAFAARFDLSHTLDATAGPA